MSTLTLTDEQLLYILDVQLPEMLERQPELESRAYHAFLRAFATKGELAAIVQELREIGYQAIQARTETAWNLEQVRDDVHDLHTEMTEGFTQVRGEIQNLRAETMQHFEQVDQRLDQVDQRLDQVDQRFEQVDQRFEQVDQRLEQVDQRLEQVDQRLEQVDQRLEQVDQRLEQVDQRLEQVDQRLEQVDQRFGQVDQRFGQVDQRFDQLGQKIDDLKDWVHLVVGRFQVRAGKKLEDVVAGTLRLALKRPDIRPDRIQLRQRVVDEIGLVGPPGQRRFEIDILIDDGQITVFEVKSVCEAEDVDRLADKITLMRALHPDQQVTGVMIALGVEEEAQALCAQYGIPLVY